MPGGLFLGDEEFKLFDPPLIAAVLILLLIAVAALALATLVERVDPQPPRRWTRNRQLGVASVGVLGLAVMLRNLAELT